MSFFFNTNNNINPIDNLIQLFKQSETSKLVKPVEAQKSSIQTKNSTLLDLKLKLSALYQVAKDLSAVGVNSKFQVKSAVVSNSDVLNATAQSSAIVSNHTVFVQQLAKEDTILSSRFSISGNEILNATGEGIKTIRLIINGVSTDVNVSISAGDTNNAILNKIASAINSTVGDVNATVVNPTSSTARLVIKSKNTGSQYAISMSDVYGNLLASIGLDSNTLSNRLSSTETNGGYLYTDANLLDAKIIVDGINITRSSNKISDVIPGVTIELRKAQSPGDSPVSVTIQTDISQVKGTVESFIKAYNDLIKFINDKTKTTTEGNRATFSGDQMLMKLKMELRLRISSGVSSANPSFLSDVGIKINPDGTLVIFDVSKLEKTIADDVSKIESLFNSSDGIAVRLKDFVNPFVQVGGVIDKRIDFGKEQIKRLEERIKSLNELIDERAENLRRQFAQLQSLYFAFTRQQALIQQMTSILQ
jgi:flagellar hook-associated protein 2